MNSMNGTPDQESVMYWSGSADERTTSGASATDIRRSRVANSGGFDPARSMGACRPLLPVNPHSHVRKFIVEKRSRLPVFGAVILLAGCASGARPSEMAYVPEHTPGFDRALIRQVDIACVTGGEETNPAWLSEIGNEEFAGAVARTLSGLDLFGEHGRHVLDITLHEVAQSTLGIDMEVTTRIRYVLRDSTNNEVVMDETVVASHTARMRDSLYGSTRLQLANEGSARANIKQFVEMLARLDFGPDEVPVRD